MSETLTAAIDELERLEKAVPSAPWHVSRNHGGPDQQPAFPSVCDASGREDGEDIVCSPLGTSDECKARAAFIAALRNHAPALIAAAKELVKLREERVLLTTNQHWGFELLEKLGEFAKQAAIADTPMTTKIMAKFPGGDLPVIHIWATTGDKEPAARCRELAEQLTTKREQLRQAMADGEAMRAMLERFVLRDSMHSPDLPSLCVICGTTTKPGELFAHRDTCVLSLPNPGQSIAEEMRQLRERLAKAEAVMSDKVVKSGVQINGKAYDLVETNHFNCDGCDMHVYGQDTTKCLTRNGCLNQRAAWPFCHYHEVKP